MGSRSKSRDRVATSKGAQSFQEASGSPTGLLHPEASSRGDARLRRRVCGLLPSIGARIIGLENVSGRTLLIAALRYPSGVTSLQTGKGLFAIRPPRQVS